jgi:hypothetical protein
MGAAPVAEPGNPRPTLISLFGAQGEAAHEAAGDDRITAPGIAAPSGRVSGDASSGRALDALDAAAQSPGQPVAAPIRERVEARRAASTSPACASATGRRQPAPPSAISAHAYTEGQDVHFAAGQHRPGIPEGTGCSRTSSLIPSRLVRRATVARSTLSSK